MWAEIAGLEKQIKDIVLSFAWTVNRKTKTKKNMTFDPIQIHIVEFKCISFWVDSQAAWLIENKFAFRPVFKAAVRILFIFFFLCVQILQYLYK